MNIVKFHSEVIATTKLPEGEERHVRLYAVTEEGDVYTITDDGDGIFSEHWTKLPPIQSIDDLEREVYESDDEYYDEYEDALDD